MSSVAAHEPFVFSAGIAAPAGGPSLVDQTRREISEIVREVAAAARSVRPTREFLALLADRTLRALAAEGVVIWQWSESDPAALRCIQRLGRVTDTTIAAPSAAAHLRLLTQISDEGQPVVVPPTPQATDPDIPANPTAFPAAIVPVECDPQSPRPEYLLEVFLEPDGGVATQRGYLRFVAQMADLAGKFLRAAKLRQYRVDRQLAQRIDAAITRLHETSSRIALQALIVDTATELFGMDRVAMCKIAPRPRLIAVSYVNEIDHGSAAATELCDAATTPCDADGCFWNDHTLTGNDPDADQTTLVVRAVVCLGDDHRLVCQQTVAATDSHARDELLRYARHASLALSNIDRSVGVFAAAHWKSLLRRRPAGLPLAVAGVIVAVVAGMAMVPVPLTVQAPASLRPADVQNVCAPRDAVVDQIHVTHGQPVRRGDPLVTLSDPQLEQQLITAIGNRAVLVQKQSAWTEKLVDHSTGRLDRLAREQIEAERSLVSEEIQAIDGQLAAFRTVQSSLTLRADRDGHVDAWQLQQQLQSRPLHRGDPVLRVIASGCDWLVDARVPPNRIAHLQRSAPNQPLRARVALQSQPDQWGDATLVRIGPTVVSNTDGLTSTAVLVRLDESATAAFVSDQNGDHLYGAPARVAFDCGTAAAGAVIFQDLIRTIRGTVAMHVQ